jgi:UDP-N-acetylglucosamine acyltransferase
VGEIHPTAVVHSGVDLADDVRIGPYSIVEEDVTIGVGTHIRAHAVVKRYTTLGADNQVHEGAVLGGEPQDVSFQGGPSTLRIGDRNRIREGVTIHRAGAGRETVIGSDCFLTAYAHVAHDCRVGDGVVMANNVALAGHVTIGDRAFLGGGAMVHQFCRVGRLAMVGGMSKVVQDCLPFMITDGRPARARGLNVVGLRRAGIPASQVRALKEAFRLLLRSSLPLEAALQRLAAIGDPLVDELADFARTSKRGFAHAGRGGDE